MKNAKQSTIHYVSRFKKSGPKVKVFFDAYRFIVDGEWTHDTDLPALKNDQGHYNNMVKLKPKGADVVVPVKKARGENLKKGVSTLALAAKNLSKAIAGATAARASRERTPGTAKKRRVEEDKCLSCGDETLVMSDAENVLSQNDTLVDVAAASGGDLDRDLLMSDDEDLMPVDRPQIVIESGGVPSRGKTVFLTEVQDTKSRRTSSVKVTDLDTALAAGLAADEPMPDLEPLYENVPLKPRIEMVTQSSSKEAQLESIQKGDCFR